MLRHTPCRTFCRWRGWRWSRPWGWSGPAHGWTGGWPRDSGLQPCSMIKMLLERNIFPTENPYVGWFSTQMVYLYSGDGLDIKMIPRGTRSTSWELLPCQSWKLNVFFFHFRYLSHGLLLAVLPWEAVAEESVDTFDLPGEPHVRVEGRHGAEEVWGRQL